jgi:hypothetical protein
VRWRWVLALLLLAAISVGVKLVLDELRTSEYQAREAVFAVERDPSPNIRFPSTGPCDERLSYTRLPDFVARLAASGFEIETQARHSPRLQTPEDWGLSPVYREKDRAGLRIVGRDGTLLFSTRYPDHAYTRFEDVPKAVVDALLFIENREVLDARYPKRNPAVEWDRLGRAALFQAMQVAGADTGRAGGSTLATQIEKFRHSPQGLTSPPIEKLRQMASASLRAYQDGENTTGARRPHRARLRELDPARRRAALGRGDRARRCALDLVRRGLHEHERDSADGDRSRFRHCGQALPRGTCQISSYGT